MHRAAILPLTALALLAACGGHNAADEHIPSAADIAGTYDLTATFHDTQSTERGVARIGIDSEFNASLTVPPVTLHGTLEADGTLALTGITTNSDAVLPVRARGRIAVVDRVCRVVAEITGSGMGDADVVMERPIGTDARGAAGSYRIELTPSPSGCGCPGRIDLAAAFDRGGLASIADAQELTSADHGVDGVLATLPFGSLELAPSGRFHVGASYEPIAGPCAGFGGVPCRLEIDGELPAAPGDAPGTGSFTEFSGFGFVGSSGTITIHRSERSE